MRKLALAAHPLAADTPGDPAIIPSAPGVLHSAPAGILSPPHVIWSEAKDLAPAERESPPETAILRSGQDDDPEDGICAQNDGPGPTLDPSAPAARYRVLAVAPTPFFADRGCHVRIYEEIRALQALGCEIEVTTYHLGGERLGIKTHRTLAIPWYTKLAAGPSWHKLYLDLLLLLKTWRVARVFRPDVIHGHLHEGAAIGWLVGRLLDVPVVGDFQGSLAGEMRAHRFIPARGWIHRFVAHNEGRIDRLPDAAVASCSDVAEELRAFGVPEVIVALDGVDTGTFRPGLDVAELQHLVPPGRRAVVYLGILSPYQGVDHLLEAVPLVLARVPEAYFLIMGYPDEDRYRQKARDLGLESDVAFPGRVEYDRAAHYLALGEVAVGPKLSETESNGKLYNYMACALPTVAFDTPPSREILGDLGVYAPAGDTPALAAAIAGLLEDPEAARDLGRKLRRRVVDCFSWESTARQLLAAYARSGAAVPAPVPDGSKRAGKRAPDAAAAKRARGRVLNILKVLVSLAVLGAIVAKIDFQEVLPVLAEMHWLPFVAALALFLGGALVRAYRWGALVWAQGVHVSWGRLASLYYVGIFFSQILPTGMGGDAVRMYELSRDDHRAAPAISSVLVDRFLGLLVLFAMALLALLGGYELVTPGERLLIAALFVASVVAAGLVLQRTWLESWGRRFGAGRLLRRFKILDELYRSLHVYGRSALLRATIASVAWNLILVLGYYLLGQAVGADLELWYYFLLVPIISVFLMLPSLGGLGVREGVTLLVFTQMGVEEPRAMALGLAYLLTLWITALLGAVLYIRQSVRSARRPVA